MMLFCRNYLVFFLSPTLLILCYYVFCFYPSQEIETIRPCVYVYTLHSDEVVSLISGGESVVSSCSPMQCMDVDVSLSNFVNIMLLCVLFLPLPRN